MFLKFKEYKHIKKQRFKKLNRIGQCNDHEAYEKAKKGLGIFRHKRVNKSFKAKNIKVGTRFRLVKFPSKQKQNLTIFYDRNVKQT